MGAGICFALLFLINQRTVNAYLFLFCIPLYLAQLIFIKNKLNRWFCLSFIIIALSGFAFITWATNQSGIWKASMGNILSGHVAHYPGAMGYFKKHGMPDNISKQLNDWVNQPYYMGGNLFQTPDTKAWVNANSRKIYMQLLLTNPSYLLSPFSRDYDKPNNLSLSYNSVLYNASEQYMYLYGSPKYLSLYNLLYYWSFYCGNIVCVLFFMIIALSLIYHRNLCSFSMFSALYYFLISLPLFLFIWHGDAGEPARHQLIVYVNLFLSLFLCLVVLLRKRVIITDCFHVD